MKFEDFEFEANSEGTRTTANFPNGYGVSVITGFGSYTSAEGPYEVAILKDGVLCYDTPITSDVLGYQSEEDVGSLLLQVEALPKAVMDEPRTKLVHTVHT